VVVVVTLVCVVGGVSKQPARNVAARSINIARFLVIVVSPRQQRSTAFSQRSRQITGMPRSGALTPAIRRSYVLANEASASCAEAERMLQEAKYIWNDEHREYIRARRKGRSPADDRRNEPDVISEEELSDHGLTHPDALPKERRAACDWLTERIRQGG